MLKKIATGRNFGNLVGGLLVAYALWGYFSGEIRVIIPKSMKASAPSPYVHDGEQVMLAALGYLAFAVVAFLCAAASAEKRADPLGEDSTHGDSGGSPGKLVLAIVFMVIGLVLLGFRNLN